MRTTDFLLAIVGEGAENGILLAGHAVCSTFDIILGTGRVVLGLSGNVLFAARLLPRGRPRKVANCLDKGALGGVELASGFAENRSAQVEGRHGRLGGSVLWLSLGRVVGRHCSSGSSSSGG